MAIPTTLPDLRQLLAHRFPQTHRAVAAGLLCDVPVVDELGGLPRAALTELVCITPSSGSYLFVAHLLRLAAAFPARMALVDADDQFDPASASTDLSHLLWVRCAKPADVIPVADLLARDANFDLLVLDLGRQSLPFLKRIPAAAWYRLQRAAEQANQILLVLTPASLVPNAQLRLELRTPYSLEALHQPQTQLLRGWQPVIQRQRLAWSA